MTNKNLQPYFLKNNLDAFLITDLHNVRFLTGFTGTNGVALVTKKKTYFFTDFRYWEQAEKQVYSGIEIVRVEQDITGSIHEKLRNLKIKKLGVEDAVMPYAQFLRLKKALSPITLVPISGDPGTIRKIKTEIEIKKIQKACAINKLAFDEVRPQIKPGKTEIEIARLLEIAMLRHGAEKIGFDTIVASGPRGALPHGVATRKKIKAGEMVTIDFGCVFDGYNSDETVTIVIEPILPLPPPLRRRGFASPSIAMERVRERTRRQLAIYQIVFDAQRAAISIAGPGVHCSDIDKAARDYITKKGYGQYFGHALGHGVGLEVHERPVLSSHSNDVLEPGMVFTIEPGIYIPGFGGVRVEDVFVCTKNGVKKLTKIKKILRL